MLVAIPNSKNWIFIKCQTIHNKKLCIAVVKVEIVKNYLKPFEDHRQFQEPQ